MLAFVAVLEDCAVTRVCLVLGDVARELCVI